MSRRQAGFTIIELLVATLVFSVIILTITVAVIRFSKQYYHGVIVNATQDTARSIMDDLVRSVQFNGGDVLKITSGGNGYCLGSTKRYSYKLNQPAIGNTHALVSDTNTTCSGAAALSLDTPFALSASSNARELLGQHMRLAKFDIAETVAGSKTYVVSIKIAYGDNDLLSCNDTSPACQNTIKCNLDAGAEYCAVAQLTTVIKKRIN